jgi:hypothetical protein
MSARSRFLKDREPISKHKSRFENWLSDRGYAGCSSMYPAAISTSTLVDEYLEDYPEREEYRDLIEEHAEEIGWISDYDDEGEDDEDLDTFD